MISSSIAEALRQHTSFANMHWPGLYSIVIGGTVADGLSRLFVALPGDLHPHLRDPAAPFLHHAHAYDFKSTTLAGVVESDVYMRRLDGEKFHAYSFRRDVAPSDPLIQHEGLTALTWTRSNVCLPGESYWLSSEKIHRVIFHACPRTAWLAVRIDECNPTARPRLAYARHFMFDVPNRDELYQPISIAEASEVLEDLQRATGVQL